MAGTMGGLSGRKWCRGNRTIAVKGCVDFAVVLAPKRPQSQRAMTASGLLYGARCLLPHKAVNSIS